MKLPEVASRFFRPWRHCSLLSHTCSGYACGHCFIAQSTANPITQDAHNALDRRPAGMWADERSVLVDPNFLDVVRNGGFDLRIRQLRNVENASVSHSTVDPVLSKGRRPYDAIQRRRVVLRGVVEAIAGDAKEVMHNRALRERPELTLLL